MKVKTIPGWRKLNADFGKWYEKNNCPSWRSQKRWFSKELLKRNLIEEDTIHDMWVIFHKLTDGCSNWRVQNQILSFIIRCLDKKIREDLENYIK